MRAALLVLLAACADPPSGGGASIVEPPLDPGENSDPGDTTPPDPPSPPVLRGPAMLAGLADLDDDDNDRRADLADLPPSLNNDLVPLEIEPGGDAASFGVTQLTFAIRGDTDRLRVWHGDTLLLGGDTLTASLSWPLTTLTLHVGFGDLLQDATLTVEQLGADGPAGEPLEVALTSAPLMLNHHLQPAEAVWAVAVNSRIWGDNTAFIQAFTDALGPAFTVVPGERYDGDVWFQDEHEFATTSTSDRRLDVVIDSIRDRGLDAWSEREHSGPDLGSLVAGTGRSNSQDSFGNLEVSPPVTVDGVEHPFGRIYYGANADFGPTPALRDLLASQVVQDPIELDTSWLCVGHVDEFISFVPDSTAPKGFRMAYADVDTAWAVIDGLDPAMRLPKYASRFAGHGIATVGDLQSDRGLRAYNDDIRDRWLLVLRAQLMGELGLTEEDVIAIPSLFEAPFGCEGTAAALIPGMVNLVVANVDGSAPKVLLADPFFRSDLDDLDSDPIIADVRRRMPAELELVFVDDWSTYHKALGEVHCGSNIKRTPTPGAWERVRAILGGAL
jgi:protein-arginine deiminase